MNNNCNREIADSGGSESEGLLLIACWDFGFESRRGHKCLCCVLYSEDNGKSQENQGKETNAG
jgi:hypothetical protein